MWVEEGVGSPQPGIQPPFSQASRPGFHSPWAFREPALLSFPKSVPYSNDAMNRGEIKGCPPSRTRVGRPSSRINIPRRPALPNFMVSPGRQDQAEPGPHVRGRTPCRHPAHRSLRKSSLLRQTSFPSPAVSEEQPKRDRKNPKVQRGVEGSTVGFPDKTSRKPGKERNPFQPLEFARESRK